MSVSPPGSATAGVTPVWLWNRVDQKNDAWPRRLVLCLPMRTLVEQTKRAASAWLEQAGINPRERVHVLMGGLSPSDWHLEPEREAILIGTQDMLLSRALNRGYGSGRARWPMEHALLNVDCLWVMDEIQLMDVGLATSAQLQGFASRDDRDGKIPRPRRTWWMSATLQRDWLRRAPDLDDVDVLPILQLSSTDKSGPLWTVAKTVRVEHVPVASDEKTESWVNLVVNTHRRTNRGVTLAIANTVKSAVALHKALEKRKKASALPADPDVELVHSRFRGEERRQWANRFLAREQCGPGRDLIIVATQVVEAGVDISANALLTELAPWASLVQRFGRCARYGGPGEIVVVDRRHTDESAEKIASKDKAERDTKRRDEDRSTAKPYVLEEVEAAAEAVASLAAAGPAALEELEERRRDLLPHLYPYSPFHVLTRRELRDLFDTGPDLTGADIDISRFVREGDERDVTVWWWPIPEGESPQWRLRPAHDALCRVPISDARKWLVAGAGNSDDDVSAPGTPGNGAKKAPAPPRAWVWSYLDGKWERLDERHVYPGQTILVDAGAGGYDQKVGFTGKPGEIRVVAEHARGIEAADAADAADEQDELSEGVSQGNRQYKTIATHGAEVAIEAQKVAKALGLHKPEARVLELAGLAHDIGKAHPAFAGAIRDRNGIAPETPLAKAPKGRWRGLRDMYNHSSLGKRPGFRHEVASALALLELGWRARPDHPALQGGHAELLDLTVGREPLGDEERIDKAQGMTARLIELDATMFNLVAYLVMCHHGKVRATLPMSPRDQDNPDRDGNLPIRGVRAGDVLPALVLADTEGREFELPPLRLSLQPASLGLSPRYGPSWVERVLGLRERYGDFQLTWLETLLRVADIRASKIAAPRDPRLPVHVVEVPSVPETEDRDAELRQWIIETLAAAAAERHAVTPRRREVSNRTEPKPPRTIRKKSSRGIRGDAP
ncbi:MAG: helicase-related protein [Candidatus Eisenbacteria bacterium]